MSDRSVNPVIIAQIASATTMRAIVAAYGSA